MSQKEKERVLLEQLMKEYYQHHNVRSIIHWTNEFSVIDGIVVSGKSDTDNIKLPIEVKQREGSITKYYSSYLEKQKHDDILQLMKLTDAPIYLYVSDFTDALTVHTITPTTAIKWELVESQRTNSDYQDRRMKDMSFLPYDPNNTIVISKTDGVWKERTVDHLMHHIRKTNGDV